MKCESPCTLYVVRCTLYVVRCTLYVVCALFVQCTYLWQAGGGGGYGAEEAEEVVGGGVRQKLEIRTVKTVIRKNVYYDGFCIFFFNIKRLKQKEENSN